MRYDDTTEVALQETLEDKCKRRDAQAQILLQIVALAKKLDHCQYELAQMIRNPEYINDVDIENLRKRLDYSFWHQCLEENQVEKFLTTTDKERLYKKLEDDTPTFNFENVNSTIYGFMGSKEATATVMIKKIYEEVTNICFTKGQRYPNPREKRIQKGIPKVFRASVFFRQLPGYVSMQNSRFNLIDDLERACFLVDGKLQPDRQLGVRSKTDTALRSGNMWVNSNYFQLQLFKNGNVKVHFTNIEVLERLNAWGMRGDRVDETG